MLHNNLNKRSKKEFEQLMIEGYKEMAEDNLAMTKEWETVDLENWPEYDYNFRNNKRKS